MLFRIGSSVAIGVDVTILFVTNGLALLVCIGTAVKRMLYDWTVHERVPVERHEGTLPRHIDLAITTVSYLVAVSLNFFRQVIFIGVVRCGLDQDVDKIVGILDGMI